MHQNSQFTAVLFINSLNLKILNAILSCRFNQLCLVITLHKDPTIHLSRFDVPLDQNNLFIIPILAAKSQTTTQEGSLVYLKTWKT